MRILCLSNAAGKLLQSLQFSFAAVTLAELEAKLASDTEPAIVVGELFQIDNRLADLLERGSGGRVPVGIVPYHPQHEDSFARLLAPSAGVPEVASTVGLYSSRGLDFDYREPSVPFAGTIVKLRRRSEAEGTITSRDDAALQISRHDFTSLAVVTEGRQSYCLVGMGCLHPTISAPELGRLSPRDVRARHWLLQSCHSPFMWPELGSYLTLPLSIALTSRAETVICSTHVQTYIPNLLNLYLDLTSDGMPMGDIVRALNNHAATEGVDYRPFMLLGNPESRALVADRATPRKSAGSSPDPKAKEVSQLLRRFVANVGFVSNAANFGFQKNNEPHSQFRRDMAWLARADIRSLSRAGRSESDIEGLIDGIRPPNERISLKQATLRLSEAWEEAGGFYAVGEQLDEMYGPEGAQQLDTCCQVCGERLIERRLSYLGQNISVEYSERRQVICPRCLVVEHVSPMHRQATNVVAVRSGQEFVTRVSYTNITSQPQWVYSFAFLSDPNNVSRSTAERAYKRLLERTVCRRAQQAPRSIGPGGKFDFEFRTGPVPEDFWYLLLEVNLMVDFCWNWFSFTFREKRIEDWLRSERYSSTLPRIKAGILST